MMQVMRELLKLLNPLTLMGQSVQTHAKQQNNVKSHRTFFLNSSGEPKASKYTKYVSFNFGEISIEECKILKRIFPFDRIVQPQK